MVTECQCHWHSIWIHLVYRLSSEQASSQDYTCAEGKYLSERKQKKACMVKFLSIYLFHIDTQSPASRTIKSNQLVCTPHITLVLFLIIRNCVRPYASLVRTWHALILIIQ